MSPWSAKIEKLDKTWINGGWIARGAIFLAIGSIIWAVGLFFKWPLGFATMNHFPRLDDFLKLCNDPLARDLNEPILAYRLTTPVLAKLLGLNPWASAHLAWAALAISYATCWVALRRHTNSLYALIIAFSLSQSFYAHTSIRWLGLPDAVTLLAIACCLLSRKPFVIALCVFLGMMNDERFIMAVPSLFFWQILPNPQIPEKATQGYIKSLWVKFFPIITGIGLGLLLVLAMRYALTVGWIGPGIQRPELYKYMTDQAVAVKKWTPYASSWGLFSINVVFSFSWMWIYYGYVFLATTNYNNNIYKIAAALYLSISILSTTLVTDVSRSLSFIYPMLLFGSILLYKTNKKKCLKIALLIGIVMAITPSIYYGAYGSGGVFLPYSVEKANNVILKHTKTNILIKLKKILSQKRSSY